MIEQQAIVRVRMICRHGIVVGLALAAAEQPEVASMSKLFFSVANANLNSRTFCGAKHVIPGGKNKYEFVTEPGFDLFRKVDEWCYIVRGERKIKINRFIVSFDKQNSENVSNFTFKYFCTFQLNIIRSYF